MSYGGSSGGSSRISTSLDAALSNPATGEGLIYNASTQKWVNGTFSKLSGITVSGTPASGQVLTATSASAASWSTPASGSGGSGSSATYTPIVNVKDYGATGNASTDDYSAINSAIQTVANRTTGVDRGGVVYFPPGNYKVGTKLAVPSHIYLVGENSSAVQMFYGGATLTTDAFVTIGTANNISVNSGVRDISINGGTNVDTTLRLYGPQEGSAILGSLINGAKKYTVEVISSGMYGGSNKFVIDRSWIWVENSAGMAALNFPDSYAGQLTISNTTLVCNNRGGSNVGGPAGSAGIIAAAGAFNIINVNVEYFESAFNLSNSRTYILGASAFFCTHAVTVNTTGSATVVENAAFDNGFTSYFRNTANSTTVTTNYASLTVTPSQVVAVNGSPYGAAVANVGWTNIGYASGYTAGTALQLQYKIFNDVVYIRGGATGTFSAGTYTQVTDTTGLPSVARPTSVIRGGAAGTGLVGCAYEINNTDGSIKLGFGGSTVPTWIAVTVSYPVSAV